MYKDTLWKWIIPIRYWNSFFLLYNL